MNMPLHSRCISTILSPHSTESRLASVSMLIVVIGKLTCSKRVEITGLRNDSSSRGTRKPNVGDPDDFDAFPLQSVGAICVSVNSLSSSDNWDKNKQIVLGKFTFKHCYVLKTSYRSVPHFS